jgi:hypothetical protein
MQDIANAKDPDLRSSLTALRRASVLARKAAIQTDTALVIVMDGRIVVVEAKTLREQAESEGTRG